MQKIATHDSATGEKPRNFLSWISSPFAVTQSKTIKEQYEAGCRYFDFRLRKKENVWICCHGLFETEKTFEEILADIPDGYMDITFEDDFVDEPTGKTNIYNFISKYLIHTETTKQEFIDYIDYIVEKYPHIKLCAVNVKYPTWEMIRCDNTVPIKAGFLGLNGSTWHTYLPIPWLWKKIYNDKPEFNEDYYLMVDFL